MNCVLESVFLNECIQYRLSFSYLSLSLSLRLPFPSSNNNIHNIIGIALTNYSLPHALSYNFFGFLYKLSPWFDFRVFSFSLPLCFSVLSILMFHSKFGHSEKIFLSFSLLALLPILPLPSSLSHFSTSYLLSYSGISLTVLLSHSSL